MRVIPERRAGPPLRAPHILRHRTPCLQLGKGDDAGIAAALGNLGVVTEREEPPLQVRGRRGPGRGEVACMARGAACGTIYTGGASLSTRARSSPAGQAGVWNVRHARKVSCPVIEARSVRDADTRSQSFVREGAGAARLGGAAAQGGTRLPGDGAAGARCAASHPCLRASLLPPRADPFDPESPIKKMGIKTFPPDMFFVLRVVQASARGLGMGV